MGGRWRVIAWLVVAGAGCDEAFDALSDHGVCAAQYDSGPVCYEPTNGSNRAKHTCDDKDWYIPDTTCAELGYTELCQDSDGMGIYLESPEACDAWLTDNTTTTST
ncbi:MAG: hypothetical protein ABMB14_31060 [Myxococcota bacterium]